ncbi:MAG: hypothetical protein M1823_000351 [Watsoniomyces obsoletus]|nr:MAG: hypothetical protein M1823_000351 [Watsoniomyces obsoletus]
MSASEVPLPVSMADVFTISGSNNAQDEQNKTSSSSSSSSSASARNTSSGPKSTIMGIPRWTLGILLLMVTVVMWTSSNFLASYIFADNTYSKPYFVTFANTAVFAFSLIPMLIKRLQDHQEGETLWLRFRAIWDDDDHRGKQNTRNSKNGVGHEDEDQDDDDVQSPLIGHASSDDSSSSSRPLSASQQLLVLDSTTHHNPQNDTNTPLPFRSILKLSIEFSTLWFAANYSAAACLEFTTVGSATILTSTSSIWTLIFGSLMGVESFSYRKLLGVLSSVTGIILISSVDLSGSTDQHRGNFPHKSIKELLIGDILALLSAVIYGFYTVLMKKRIGNESRVDVLLFFALVGLSNLLLLWPGFFVLHYTGVESWEWPPSGRVWIVIIPEKEAGLVDV